MKVPIFVWFLAITPLAAELPASPLAGAWEAFPTQANADAWAVYDYSLEAFYLPGWTSAEGGYAFRLLNKNPSGPSGVWFFGNSSVASGALVGDYGAKNIRGLRVKYFIDPAKVRELDCSIRATGPAGTREYLSEFILGDDLQGGAAWRTGEFLFNTQWYYVDACVYYATPVTPGMLATIQRIGFRFVPRDSNTTSTLVAIDDVVLVPTVTAPALTTGTSGTNFTLSFTPAPGTACTIQQPNAGNWADWIPVSGQQGITAARTFQTPLTPAKGFFRVEATENLTAIVTPP